MLLVVQTALELGFLYAPVALALFLSFRVLDIADLTTDGCFVLGAAVSVTLTAAGHPLLAVPAAMLAGGGAGGLSGVTATKAFARGRTRRNMECQSLSARTPERKMSFRPG